MNRNGIFAVIFDLDDTLIDSMAAGKYMMRKFIQRDFPMEHENALFIEKIIKDILCWQKQHNMLMGKEAMEKGFDYYCEKYGIKNRTGSAYCAQYCAEVNNYINKYPKTDEVLKYLKEKYCLAMITNGASERQKIRLENARLNHYFDEIIIGEEYGVMKPDKRIFYEMCRRLELRPEQCVYVGDKVEYDMKGAAAAGMKPVWIYPYDDQNCSIKHKRIKKIEELMRIL